MFISCNSSVDKTALETSLKLTRDSLTTLKRDIVRSKKGKLVHLVLFDTKSEDATAELIDSLIILKSIPDVTHFQLGKYESQNDPRALKNYELMMQMQFQNEQAYTRYQLNTTHKRLKETTKHLMAGPPSTYHYIIE